MSNFMFVFDYSFQLLSASTIAYATSLDHETIGQLLEKGSQILNFHNYSNAVSYFDKAISLEPDNIDAWFLKGVAYDGLQNYTSAITSYHKAISIAPNMTNLWIKAGNDYLMLSNYSNAVSYFDKAISLEPDNIDAWFLKGVAYDGLQNYTSAITSYHKAISIAPNMTNLWIKAGNDYLMLSNYSNAVSYFDKAISLEPDNIDAWFLKGVAYDGLQNYTSAITSYHKAISIAPNMTNLWIKAGNDYLMLSNYSNAVSYFDKAISLEPDNIDAWFLKGVAYDGLQNYTSAITSYHKAISIAPNMTNLWIKAGNDYLMLSNYSNAVSYFDKAISLEPDNIDAWFLKGVAYDGLQNYTSAITSYHKAISIAPNMTNLWIKAGNDYLMLSNYSNAVSYFDKAISLEPDNIDAWFLKGVAYDGLQNYTSAITSYHKAISIAPNMTNLWIKAGNDYLMLSNYSNAVSYFDKAISLEPDNIDAWFLKSTSYLHLSEFQKTIQSAEITLRLNSSFAKAYILVGNAYDGMYVAAQKNNTNPDAEALRNAIKNYEEAVDLEPENSIPYSSIAADYLLLKEYEDAIEYSDEALKREPANVYFNAYLTKARAYDGISINVDGAEKNNPDAEALRNAIKNYEEAVDLEPENSIPYSSIAADYLLLKEYEDAIEYSDEALKREPANVYFNAYLTKARAYDGISINVDGAEKNNPDAEALRNAIKNYEEAVDLEPENSIPYSSIAADYLLLKEYEDAIEYSDEALKREPANVYFNAYLTKANANSKLAEISSDEQSITEHYHAAISNFESARILNQINPIPYVSIMSIGLELGKRGLQGSLDPSGFSITIDYADRLLTLEPTPSDKDLFVTYLMKGSAFDGINEGLPEDDPSKISNYKNAISNFQSANSLNQSNPEPYEAIMRDGINLGRLDTSGYWITIDYADRLLTLEPTPSDKDLFVTYLMKGSAFDGINEGLPEDDPSKISNYKNAISNFQSANSLNQSNPEPYEAIMRDGINLGRLDTSGYWITIDYADQLLYLNPSPVDSYLLKAYTSKGMAYSEVNEILLEGDPSIFNNYERAISNFESAIFLDPDDINLYKIIMAVGNKFGKYTSNGFFKTIEYADKIITNKPEAKDDGLFHAYLFRGNAKAGLHQYNEAIIDHFNAEVNTDSCTKKATSYMAIGMTLLKEHQLVNKDLYEEIKMQVELMNEEMDDWPEKIAEYEIQKFKRMTWDLFYKMMDDFGAPLEALYNAAMFSKKVSDPESTKIQDQADQTIRGMVDQLLQVKPELRFIEAIKLNNEIKDLTNPTFFESPCK